MKLPNWPGSSFFLVACASLMICLGCAGEISDSREITGAKEPPTPGSSGTNPTPGVGRDAGTVIDPPGTGGGAGSTGQPPATPDAGSPTSDAGISTPDAGPPTP